MATFGALHFCRQMFYYFFRRGSGLGYRGGMCKCHNYEEQQCRCLWQADDCFRPVTLPWEGKQRHTISLQAPETNARKTYLPMRPCKTQFPSQLGKALFLGLTLRLHKSKCFWTFKQSDWQTSRLSTSL